MIFFVLACHRVRIIIHHVATRVFQNGDYGTIVSRQEAGQLRAWTM